MNVEEQGNKKSPTDNNRTSNLKNVSEKTLSMEGDTTPEKLDDTESDVNVKISVKKNLVTEIVDEVMEDVELFIDERKSSYVRLEYNKHYETWPVNSTRFRGYLYKIGRQLNNQEVPSPESISAARKYLEALAYDTGEIMLHNRVAKHEGSLYYDLTDNYWLAAKITPEGWCIIDAPNIFRREAHQKPQMKPLKENGDPWKFFEFVNYPKQKELLLMVYLVSSFIPDIPHPIPIIYGPPGSGKSLLMEFLRNTIDPSYAPKLKIPKGDKDIVQTFDHHYAPYFDNLDTINSFLSDMMCRAVTGEGSEHRKLYTDDEPVIRSYRRCVGLTGINVPARKGDLLDRAILFGLDTFPPGNRQDEESLREEFKKELPTILGGIFDVVSKAMSIYPTVDLEELPRMADFAKWGYAIAEALGNRGDEFIEDYSLDEAERVRETIDANPFASAVIELLKISPDWEGHPTELLTRLENVAESNKINIDAKIWPKSANWVTRRLHEIKPFIVKEGFSSIKRRKPQPVGL